MITTSKTTRKGRAAGTATTGRRWRTPCGRARATAIVLALGAALALAAAAHAAPTGQAPVTTLADVGHGSGSTIGPDGALYVTQGVAGEVLRIDRSSGQVTTYVTGLPRMIQEIGIGGPIDVAFLGRTAYVLVTLVESNLGGDETVGIYRVDGPDDVTVVADLGAFGRANLREDIDTFIDTGVHYAMEPYRGGFLVTDGHHNRLLLAGLDGTVTEVQRFANTVPTGLEVSGRTVYMTEAGPVPHLPATGRVLALRPPSATTPVIATGGRLLVDVERGPGRQLYGLSQGAGVVGAPDGSPAAPETGALLRVERGLLTTVVGQLDRPTSFELVGQTAYVVTLDGTVLAIDDVSPRHHGRPRR